MTTIGHKSITGNQLHEDKGASTATADYVYVADGAASGAWAKLTSASLTTTGNPFGAQLFHLTEQQTATTSATASSSATWNKRTLASVTNEISGASVASSVVTLAAGTYWLQGYAIAYATDTHQLRWRNTSDSTTTLVGAALYNSSAVGSSTTATVYGRFTITGSKNFELQHYQTTGGAGHSGQVNGAGTSSEVEIYVNLMIWLVA